MQLINNNDEYWRLWRPTRPRNWLGELANAHGLNIGISHGTAGAGNTCSTTRRSSSPLNRALTSIRSETVASSIPTSSTWTWPRSSSPNMTSNGKSSEGYLTVSIRTTSPTCPTGRTTRTFLPSLHHPSLLRRSSANDRDMQYTHVLYRTIQLILSRRRKNTVRGVLRQCQRLLRLLNVSPDVGDKRVWPAKPHQIKQPHISSVMAVVGTLCPPGCRWSYRRPCSPSWAAGNPG